MPEGGGSGEGGTVRVPPIDINSVRRLKKPKGLLLQKRTYLEGMSFFGAGEEARTLYLHLGKVALYRMSYARIYNHPKAT